MNAEILKYLNELSLKDNTTRKQAFDELLKLTESKVDWADEAFNVLAPKLESPNSFQRSIAMMLLSNLAKSGIENRMADILPAYLARLDDEKFITARQSIQACYKAAICCYSKRDEIINRLFSLYNSSRHIATHANLIQKDIVTSLYTIYKECPDSVDAEKLKTCIAQTDDKKLIKTLMVGI